MPDEVQSVVRAFAVLRTLARYPTPVPLAAIAVETGLPKSTLSRLLATLESRAMVERGDADGTYTIGAGVETFTGRPASTAQLVAVAHPYLLELTQRYEEDAGLTVADGQAVLSVHQVQSPNPVQVQDWTGTRFPPHAVAAGHVTMAGWSEEELAAYLAGDLAPTTRRTVTEPGELRARVQAARRAGYAWTFEEWAEGVNGVAAPIHHPDGTLAAAINLYGPAYRFPGAATPEVVGRDLAETAARVARHFAMGEG
jgi:DNA-binding IclR family transcriptional regulator